MPNCKKKMKSEKLDLGLNGNKESLIMDFQSRNAEEYQPSLDSHAAVAAQNDKMVDISNTRHTEELSPFSHTEERSDVSIHHNKCNIFAVCAFFLFSITTLLLSIPVQAQGLQFIYIFNDVKIKTNTPTPVDCIPAGEKVGNSSCCPGLTQCFDENGEKFCYNPDSCEDTYQLPYEADICCKPICMEKYTCGQDCCDPNAAEECVDRKCVSSVTCPTGTGIGEGYTGGSVDGTVCKCPSDKPVWDATTGTCVSPLNMACDDNTICNGGKTTGEYYCRLKTRAGADWACPVPYPPTTPGTCQPATVVKTITATNERGESKTLSLSYARSSYGGPGWRCQKDNYCAALGKDLIDLRDYCTDEEWETIESTGYGYCELLPSNVQWTAKNIYKLNGEDYEYPLYVDGTYVYYWYSNYVTGGGAVLCE